VTEDVDVGKVAYEKFEEGDTAQVYIKQGYFGIAWFVVG